MGQCFCCLMGFIVSQCLRPLKTGQASLNILLFFVNASDLENMSDVRIKFLQNNMNSQQVLAMHERR